MQPLSIRPMALTAAAFVAAMAGLPAQAGDVVQMPRGCTAYATVQQRSCQVSYHYRCEGDAPGDQWTAAADGDGLYFASRIDSETRWLESIDLITGDTDRIGTEADPASFSDLLSKGRDTFDFETNSDRGETRRYVGFDEMTGETVTIDGVDLERTRFELKTYGADGSLLWTRKGQQLVHRDWRLFFADREDFENAEGDKASTVDTPVTFSFPGQAGFLAAKPQYDCDMMMTRALLPERRSGS